MTAVTGFGDYQGMALSTVEDQMELGISPYPNVEGVDDLDFEFDQTEPPKFETNNDNPMDDATDTHVPDDQDLAAEDVDLLGEDEYQPHIDQEQWTTDQSIKETFPEEEEILYEEEEEPAAEPGQVPQPVKSESYELEIDYSDNELELSTEQERNQQAEQDHNNNHQLTEPNGEEEYIEEQYERDDGDGPSVNPTVTELGPDLDDTTQHPFDETTLHLEEELTDDVQEQLKDVQAEEGAIESADTVPAESPSELPVEQPAASTALLDLPDITLVFFGEDYPLFPPSELDATVALFPDTSLADRPVEELLKSCLPKVNLPAHFNHHDELVLSIPQLGLEISDDSKSASHVTIRQIAQLYRSFKENESADSYEMKCELTSRTCTLTQLAYLRDQSQAGATFSGIAAEHVQTPSESEDAPEAELPEDASSAAESGEDDQANERLPNTLENPAYDGAEGLAEPENEQDYVFDEYDASAAEEARAVAEEDVEQDAEAPEFFEEAIEEQPEAEAQEEAEERQEEAEDQAILQEAVIEDGAGAEALPEDDEAQDYDAAQHSVYDAEEFLIEDDEEEAKVESGVAASAVSEHDEQHAVQDDEPIADSNAAEPTTPSTPSKTSKRKFSAKDDDILIDYESETPAKRRRPS
jgi:hypothetical protein